MNVKRRIKAQNGQAACPFCSQITSRDTSCQHFVCTSNDGTILFKGDEEVRYSNLQSPEVKEKLESADVENQAKFHAPTWEEVSKEMIMETELKKTETELKNPRDFILAGKAIFTVLNTETENRFTYEVRKPEGYSLHFVSVLNGQNNSTDYKFLGTIFDQKMYRHGNKSTIRKEAQSNQAFDWIWKRLQNGNLPAKVKIFHEGRCARCGTRLTVPESIESGFGPECVKKI